MMPVILNQKALQQLLNRNQWVYPLVTLRVVFGVMMMLAIVRFWLNGWIEELYIAPSFHFPFFGWTWLQPLPGVGMYVVFAMLFVLALCIALGLFYRVASATFFVLFSYVELIDKTYYLNHYYFISLMALLMCFLPAHRALSFDVRYLKQPVANTVPAYFIIAPRLLLAMVYFFAGVAKLNPDWLLHAQPLATWLPSLSHLPILGPVLALPATAYVFSWAGALFDISIGILMFLPHTRMWAYVAIIIFHIVTGWLFPSIGMFPWLMTSLTLVFFSEDWHKKLWRQTEQERKMPQSHPIAQRLTLGFLTMFFVVQFVLPLRYLGTPGNVMVHEDGYRFAWRVMLMEKYGWVRFSIKDNPTGAVYSVNNKDYLTPLQEKMMATQPDMIYDFARYLSRMQGSAACSVYAEAYVTVNGRGSAPYFSDTINIASLSSADELRRYITYK